jgi:anaphase-promoting complex subunit 1
VLDVQLSPPPEGVKYSEPRPDAAELEWPEFHNGVATALELSMQSVSLDSGWIFSHHTGDVSPREAGFLLGIGLLGQLSALGRVHMFRYLRPRSGGLAPVAILLGLGASLIGTGDVATRQLIAMHLPAFQPAGSLDLNLTMIEQATSLMSMGLLFMASDHAWTAGRLLDQIGAAEVRAAQGNVSQREAYSLSAGLSLGLVMLSKGRRAEMRTTADRATITALTALMHEPPAPLLHDDDEDDESRPRVDISTTAMPATIALGLIYLRSNRADMASLIQLPASEADLDVVRPDVLLIRVLARGLIMWDAITPTSAWLDSTLPSFLQGHRPASLGEAAQLAYYNMRAGACFALALKYAGSADAVAQGIVMTELRAFAKEAAVRASTFFAKIRQHALCAGVELLGVSAAMIMAGTGDLELLKFLRIQHGRQDASVGYGAQMATHMALGLLFLGGGRFTLGTSDSAIAALVIAFFPRFPGTAQDNRAHLQAFRHLWVLAVEPRVLVAQDVSTESLAILPLRIVTREGKEIDARAPTLLPTHDTIKSLATDSARYWPTALDVTGNASHARALLGSQTVFVKRRAGQLSYADDPHGRHALSTRATGLEALLADAWSTVMDDESLDELVDSFSSSREHAIFLERICAAPWHNEAPATRAARGFCLNALMTDLTLDQSGTLSTRLALAFDARQPAARLAFVRDMPLLSAVYGDFTRLFGERAPLLQRTFVDEAFASASSDITDALLSGAQTPLALALQAYARDGSMPGSEALQLALLLAAAEMPSHAELAALRHLATEARANTSAEACAAAVRSCVSSLREARRTSPDKPIHRTVHVEPVWSPLALDQIIAAWHL